MVFVSPTWAQSQFLSVTPDNITVEEFMYNPQHGRQALFRSRNPFTCGLTGRSYTTAEVRQRIDFIARGLAGRVGWSTTEYTEWSRVACVFSLNTVWAALFENLTNSPAPIADIRRPPDRLRASNSCGPSPKRHCYARQRLVQRQ